MSEFQTNFRGGPLDGGGFSVDATPGNSRRSVEPAPGVSITATHRGDSLGEVELIIEGGPAQGTYSVPSQTGIEPTVISLVPPVTMSGMHYQHIPWGTIQKGRIPSVSLESLRQSSR